MKKTLIALAAVAVTGAASAQVTLSGGFAYGYQTEKSNNVTAKGFGVDTAAFTMAASEDLGGGLKLSGAMALGGLTRGDTPTGENFTMALSGGFGSLLLGQIEIGSGIRGLASAGAPVNNMEGEILAGAANINVAKYTLPAMIDGVALSVNHVSGNTGMGAGDSNGDSTSNGIAVDYAAGALTAKVDYTNYQVNSAGYTSKTRIAASYDMGMATVGFGSESNAAADAADADKYTIIGLSAPVGSNMTVGVVRVTREIGTAASLAGTSYGLKYNLSKRTNLSASVNRPGF